MKKFISNILPARDKLMHMILCTYIYSFASQIVENWVALLIAVSVAILIEVYDKISGKGTPEVKDALWGVKGSFIPFVIDKFVPFIIDYIK